MINAHGVVCGHQLILNQLGDGQTIYLPKSRFSRPCSQGAVKKMTEVFDADFRKPYLNFNNREKLDVWSAMIVWLINIWKMNILALTAVSAVNRITISILGLISR